MVNPKQLSSAFKALSDPTRLRMIRLLAKNRAELCVCEFVDALQERQYTISRGLRILEQAGLVEGEKDGRWVYYSLVDRDDTTTTLLHELIAAIPFDTLSSIDQKRFDKRMALRENNRCRMGIQSEQLIENGRETAV